MLNLKIIKETVHQEIVVLNNIISPNRFNELVNFPRT
jgi:hypothetical protein